MKIKQAFLRSEHNEVMTTWLDASPKLIEGCTIRLKDFRPEVKWRVEQLYNDERDASDFDWHRKWDNNI